MKKRLIQFLAYLGIGQKKFEQTCGLSNGYVNNIGEAIKDATLKKISAKYPELNINWLKTGIGKMVENIDGQKNEGERKIIPLYDEAGSIGGQNMVANMDAVSQPSDYIDTGDWFRDATSAIRHYEDSMVEYPSGCILAVKEVKDKRLIVPGRDYVIETSEYRVTKKVQTVPGGVFFVAHSTNLATYPNGTLIHPPFEVPWDAVTSISLVLGYVVNKNGGKVFYNSSKN